MYISFLWHMHQPFYKDLLKNNYVMPWTFLHAIKDYYDMIEIIEGFENIQLNFNFVPSLLEQIEDYSKVPYSDYFLKILQKDVGLLSENEKDFLLKQLFCANYDNMIKKFPKYLELYSKKRDNSVFSLQDFIDLEVLYLLSWTGYYIRKKSNIVQKLINKGKNFNQSEKIELVEELFRFIGEILPKYKNMQLSGKIEISTSPYFHPILPLLIDPSIAKIAMPDIQLPIIVENFKDDAYNQIKFGMEKYKEIFSIYPNGFWPSEGSVSDDTLLMISEHNIKWVATDEDILFLSNKNLNKKDLYFPYNFNGVNIFFRDKELSNAIGFIYSKWDYKDAAKDFYNKIKKIESDINDENAIISIILDGENAWEFYRDNGVPFLKEIYSLIIDDQSLIMTTYSNYLNAQNSGRELTHIHPGSWINANYGIWIGHPEENRAWEMVADAKKVLFQKKDSVSEDSFKMAYKELLIAEGSDWFWWYGDDFYSEMSDKFDSLFRSHIANVYSFLNEDVPFNVFQPIKKYLKAEFLKEPVDIINPVIDGQVKNYLEWLSAGIFYLSQNSSTMHYGDGYFTRLYFGFNSDNLFLRIDTRGDAKDTLKGNLLEINLENHHYYKIIYNYDKNNIKFFANRLEKPHHIEVACDKVIEIAIPYNDILINMGGEIKITLELINNDKIIERAPYESAVNIKIPKNIYLEYWSV